MTNKNKPEIRFPGFTKEWEQRKLGELTDEFKSGYSIKAENIFDKGEYPVYGGNGIRGFTDTFNHDGEFALIGRQGALSGNMNFSTNKAYFTEHAIAVRANNMNDTRFLYFLLCKLQLGRWVTQSAQPGLAVGTLVEIRTQVPGKAKEQQKIGNFFKKLGDTITLHQRELELLKETKKGFLQKMFPKEGEKVPEIRFPGFTEDWEQRKLGEVVNRYDNLRVPITASERVSGDTPYFGANGIQDYVEGYTHDGEFILVAEDGANDLKNYPVQYVSGKIWVNNHAHVIQAKEGFADNKFLVNAIKSINLEPFLVGGGRAKLNADVMMNLEVMIPIKNEQIKIGAFFKQLDDTIALHQRELDLLKETKKGFLQKLFV